MIITLRNNSRKKSLVHFDRKGMHIKRKKLYLNKVLKKGATPKQLEQIRKEIKAEKKIELIKTLLFLIIIMTAIYFGVKAIG